MPRRVCHCVVLWASVISSEKLFIYYLFPLRAKKLWLAYIRDTANQKVQLCKNILFYANALPDFRSVTRDQSGLSFILVHTELSQTVLILLLTWDSFLRVFVYLLTFYFPRPQSFIEACR